MLSKLNRPLQWMVAAAAVMALAFGAVLWTANTSEAAAPFPGRGRGADAVQDNDQYLADALGISIDELQSAREEAAAAGLAQAVEAGLITQAQADRMLERGLGRLPFGGGWIRSESGIDPQALLADALGISVDELESAHDAARAARLAEAVEEGQITQEQADRIQAMEAFQPYLRDAIQNAREQAVEQALADGVITQEQADEILSREGSFQMHRGHRGGPGRGFGGERGGPGMRMPGFRGQGEDTSQRSTPLAIPGSNL